MLGHIPESVRRMIGVNAGPLWRSVVWRVILISRIFDDRISKVRLRKIRFINGLLLQAEGKNLFLRGQCALLLGFHFKLRKFFLFLLIQPFWCIDWGSLPFQGLRRHPLTLAVFNGGAVTTRSELGIFVGVSLFGFFIFSLCRLKCFWSWMWRREFLFFYVSELIFAGCKHVGVLGWAIDAARLLLTHFLFCLICRHNESFGKTILFFNRLLQHW